MLKNINFFRNVLCICYKNLTKIPKPFRENNLFWFDSYIQTFIFFAAPNRFHFSGYNFFRTRSKTVHGYNFSELEVKQYMDTTSLELEVNQYMDTISSELEVKQYMDTTSLELNVIYLKVVISEIAKIRFWY